MNPGKERMVLRLLSLWRRCAAAESAIQWRRFFEGESFDQTHDAVLAHRRATVQARGRLVSVLACRGERTELADSKESKVPLPPIAPGLADPLAGWKANLGVNRIQMIRFQVVGMLRSFMSNRKNDFRDAVEGSTIDPATRHMLHIINGQEAWFRLDAPLHRKTAGPDGKIIKLAIPDNVRRLARAIMRNILARHGKPSMRRIGMVIDRRGASIELSKSGTFGRWIILQTVEPISETRGRREFTRIRIPLLRNSYFDKRQGERKTTIQVNQDRTTGRLSFGLLTDIAPAIRARQANTETAYVPETDAVALDFGLATLFATDQGDLLGRNFLNRLKAYDTRITAIGRHVQRSGGKVRDSKRYQSSVAALRAFVRNEVGRVLNRLVRRLRPDRLILERLDFQSTGLSKRLNRILQSCGRTVIRAKLATLEQEYGIISEEVNPAYTSQRCSCCGYVDARNRRTRDSFRCLWCGAEMHADVNGARGVRDGRSVSGVAPFGWTKGAALVESTRRFSERCPRFRSPPEPGQSGQSNMPADPRWTNPHFAAEASVARSSAASASELGNKELTEF